MTFDYDFNGEHGVWAERVGSLILDGIGPSFRVGYFDGTDGHVNIPRFRRYVMSEFSKLASANMSTRTLK